MPEENFDLSGLKMDPEEVKQLMSIQRLVAKVPDAELVAKFPDQYQSSIAAGMSDVATKGMLRFQLVNLLTQAWVNDWMKGHATRIAAAMMVGVLKAIVGVIDVLQRHDRRLDSLERWRGVVVLALANQNSVSQRLAALEKTSKETPPILVGPTLTAKTTGANVAEIARYHSGLAVGPRTRKFRVVGFSADGSAVYIGEHYLTTYQQNPGGMLFGGTDSVAVFTTGGSVNSAGMDFLTTDPKVSISVLGEAGKTINWTIVELPSDLRPDANEDPIFKPS